MNQYLKNNPVARAIFENHRAERLFENEAVDNVLKIISDACLDIYQKLVFDMAPARERNPDASRTKLSPIIDAKDIDGLVAVFRNDSAESGVRTPVYTDAKNLYLQALEKYTEALISACKVNKANEKFVLDYTKAAAQVKQRRTETLAKATKEENDAKVNDSESFYFNGDISMVNESGIFTGYKGRVEDLRKVLANLILSSNGKTSKNGYGRDWQTTFIDLDEKRKTLDTSKGAFGEKDKKALDELEKQIEKYRLEYIKASNAAMDKSLTAIENDEELNGSYGDVNVLCDEAKELKTRADSQYSTALTTIKDEHKEKEEVFNKTLFPISRGNTDADEKFKNSGLIFAIQKALCDGIPSAGKLIKSKGGPNGKYGAATKSVIATLQRMEGNKNVNGDLDQALLSDILSSDWVSDENKKAVHKALDIAKVKMNESLSTVFSFADFAKASMINENKIVFDNDAFSAELDAQYKETIANEPLSQEKGSTAKEGGDDDTESDKSADVNNLSKLLRVVYGVIKEPETFNRENGSLKQAYSPNFIKAWISALESVKDKEPKSYSYFFYDGGLYRIDSIKTSLKTPCNWPKFEKVDDIDDPKLFLTNYLKPFEDKPIGNLGLINGENRLAAVKKLMDASSSAEDSEDILRKGGMSKVYGKLSAFIVNKEIPYITMDDLKEVKDAFKKAIDDYSDDPDMGYENFIALNNLMVISANMVAYNKNKDNFVSVVKWLHDNLLTEAVIIRIMNDYVMGAPVLSERTSPSILKFDGKGGIGLVSFDDYQNYISKHKFVKFDLTKDLSGFSKAVNYEDKSSDIGKNVARNAFVINLRKIASNIYPNLKIQLRRINSKQFSDVPQTSKSNCIEAK